MPGVVTGATGTQGRQSQSLPEHTRGRARARCLSVCRRYATGRAGTCPGSLLTCALLMARRFSLADAAACVAAGVGSWFTRASLDVVAVPVGEARVAMLPAPVELAGLVTLALLSGFLLRTMLSRRSRGLTFPADRRTSAAQLLFPF